MFDISWTEFLLIGVVALVVIGPKELPGVMRTMGQWTRKVRGMAAEFQSQFQEAMREAEMADLKKQVDDMASDLTSLDPLKSVREDVETMGKDIEKSFSEPKAVEPVAEPSVEPAALPTPEQPLELKPDAASVTEPAAAPEPPHEPAAAEPATPERTA